MAFPAEIGVCAPWLSAFSHKITNISTTLPNSQIVSAFFFPLQHFIFVGSLSKMYLTLLFLLICLVLKVSDFIPRPSHGGVSGNYSGCHGVVKGPYTFVLLPGCREDKLQAFNKEPFTIFLYLSLPTPKLRQIANRCEFS